ncbi:hypothetical protein M2650_16060 [Luteimonas sp. SX5]|uniref:Uncharacterized protein n=1 Tax=Luteimonas galliterrae TaxID=2940486 RepID=A0ABT0MMN0_9GAMM|nr:hypothetical protein [Luteimonas galliterrae]MCL1636137.1 hypothetical protein [Luteimonas galliterrae]
MPTDPAARFLALKERGASPQEVYTAMRMNDLDRAQAIGLLCSVYGCPQAEAERIVASVDGPRREALTTIGGHEQLLDVLKRELGYCACAPEEALRTLRDVLRAARDRTQAANDPDPEAFGRASQALEACLMLDAAPGFASWFVYGLQQRDLIWHGFRLTDVWITDKGRWLLQAIERFPPPEA